MIEITLELAEKIGKAALAKAAELKRPMSVSIVDESGTAAGISHKITP